MVEIVLQDKSKMQFKSICRQIIIKVLQIGSRRWFWQEKNAICYRKAKRGIKIRWKRFSCKMFP